MVLSAIRMVKTGSGSASVEEARSRALDFFREVCRNMPNIMERYNLYEVITPSEMRAKVAADFRKHSDTTNPKVIDMLVYKGQEEFENYMTQSKQRHHVLSQWVVGPTGPTTSKAKALNHRPGIVTTHGESDFLKKFYESNE